MSIVITIAGTDRTKQVIQEGFQITNILTRQVDRCKFSIKKISGSTFHNFVPIIGQEIIITQDAVKIFGGLIVRVSQKLDSMGVLIVDLECEDYTRLLDRRLIPDSFTNQTVSYIINYVNTHYLTGFTTTNVVCDTVIPYIAFNYIPASECFKRLADLVNFDWYVDYDKDIHFFAKEANVAPFGLLDTNGSYLTDSLEIKQDNSQIKNVIYVRGGEYLGSTFTSVILANGTDTIYPLGYRYEDLSVTVTGVRWTVGIDNINSATAYDVLWNYQEKILKFRDTHKPSNGSDIRVGGRPYIPVRVKVRDEVSISNFVTAEGGTGEYEYLIIDNSILSKEAARARASAEINSYKATIVESQFQTYTSGLKAGQQISIDSDAHDIHSSYIINQVDAQLWTNNQFIYTVKCVTTKTMGIIDYLRNILMGKTNEFTIDPNEVIDLVETANEEITISEVVAISKSHNPISESMSISETVTAQSLNYPVVFVYAPYTPPVGYNREAVYNSSIYS